MKIYDRDLRRIKIDQVLNNELRFRGMRKPPTSIKVLAKKFDNETVRVELIDVPDHVKFARLREEKLKSKVEKKVKEETPKEVKKEEETEEKKVEAKEKEEASKDETLKLAKEQAKEQKHTVKPQNSVEKSFQSKKSQKGR